MTPAAILASALPLLLAAPPEPARPTTGAVRPDPSWKPLDPKNTVWFDPRGKRLVVLARVALREGALEHLLCSTNSKEHESVLATDAPPFLIHAGLLRIGARPGHPVRYRPKFEPPAGDSIAIELEWDEGGKARHSPARDWVKDARADRTLDRDWIFAGSELYTDPETKQTHYAAEGGDLITVANFASAILDLPLASTASNDDRVYVANTPRIPPRDTPVLMSFRPVHPTDVPRP